MTGSSSLPLRGRADRILLGGIARSGTSWVSRAINHAGGASARYEPDNVDAHPDAPDAGRLGFGPYPVLRPGDEAPLYRTLWDLAFAGRLPVPPGPRLAAGRALLRMPRPLRDPVMRAAGKVLARAPKSSRQVAVKTIMASFAIDWIVENYDPRVAIMQRNPLNVVASWVELGIHGFDLETRPAVREYYRERLGFASPPPRSSTHARTAWWVGLLTATLGEAVDRHPHWLVMDHEYMCQDPITTMRDLFDGLGLVWTAEAEEFVAASNRPGTGFVLNRVAREQPERWRERLSQAQVDEITSVLSDFPTAGWVVGPGRAGTAAAGGEVSAQR